MDVTDRYLAFASYVAWQRTLPSLPSAWQLFPFLYFDLRHQKPDLRDGTTKLAFKYKLSATTNADYSVYALVLYEQDAELVKSSGKLLVRS